MSRNSAPLSDEERAELEELRAERDRANMTKEAATQRALENERRRREEQDLRDAQERERRRAQRAYEREHPDYSVDDLEPMPAVQKVVIAVLGVAFVVLIAYLVWFNLLR